MFQRRAHQVAEAMPRTSQDQLDQFMCRAGSVGAQEQSAAEFVPAMPLVLPLAVFAGRMGVADGCRVSASTEWHYLWHSFSLNTCIYSYTAYTRMTRVYKAQTASLKLARRSRSNLVASS